MFKIYKKFGYIIYEVGTNDHYYGTRGILCTIYKIILIQNNTSKKKKTKKNILPNKMKEISNYNRINIGYLIHYEYTQFYKHKYFNR